MFEDVELRAKDIFIADQKLDRNAGENLWAAVDEGVRVHWLKKALESFKGRL